jgi:hypothetical protein
MYKSKNPMSAEIKNGAFVGYKGRVALWNAIKHYKLDNAQIAKIYAALDKKGYNSIVTFENEQDNQFRAVQILETAGL